jgi:hypothetical protein
MAELVLAALNTRKQQEHSTGKDQFHHPTTRSPTYRPHDRSTGAFMPLIRRQPKPPVRIAITCKVPEDIAALLKRYAEFLDSTQEYIVTESLRLAFTRDKDFQAWLHAAPPTTQS